MKKIILSIVFTFVFIAGCNEDFLEYYPTDRVEDSQAFETPENAMAVLYGIYDLITSETLYGSFMSVANDLRGNDVFLAEQLNWSCWVETYNFQWVASNTNFRGPASFWQYFYQVIENCNVAINADLPWDEAQNAAYKAECLARKASPDFAAAPDLLRTGSPLNRPDVAGPNWSTHITLPAYDWRMIYPIPEAELDANDALSDADQNEGYN